MPSPQKQRVHLLILAAWAVFAVLPFQAEAQAVQDEPVVFAFEEDAETATGEQVNSPSFSGEDVDYSYVGWIELNSMLRESPTPFAWVPESDMGDSLQSVLDRIARVRDSEEHLGLVVFLDQPALTLTQCTAIADALMEVREAGKTVMTFAEVYDLNDYIIASAADSVLLQKKGSLELSGIAVEEMYLAGMLEKIGVKPDLLQVGKYKGADETMMRTGPSEAWDENFDALLDDLYEQSIARIVEGRGLSRDEVEALMGSAWAMTDQQLLTNHAVDRLVDRDLIAATDPAFGEYFDWDVDLGETYGSGIDPNNPFALFSVLFQEPVVETDRPTLAVIHADGPIMSGDSSIGDGMFGEESIGSRTMVMALEDALLDDNIQGVVLRLDSPGGSALASEVIWQAVREVGAVKPIYSVVGGMAASGGYYIVCGTDQIYVQPHSILGSIGVVGGKITMGGLYDWAGVSVVRRSRGAGGDLFNSVEPFTPEQRGTVRQALELVYEQFTDRVAEGRGDRLPDVGAVAEGRLFVGTRSISNGMADRIGGVGDALADLADELGLEEGGYDVINLPGPMSLNTYLNGMFGVTSPQTGGVKNMAGVPGFLQTAERLLGPVAWQSVSRSLRGMMLLQHEPVLMLMPAAIVVK